MPYPKLKTYIVPNVNDEVKGGRKRKGLTMVESGSGSYASHTWHGSCSPCLDLVVGAAPLSISAEPVRLGYAPDLHECVPARPEWHPKRYRAKQRHHQKDLQKMKKA